MTPSLQHHPAGIADHGPGSRPGRLSEPRHRRSAARSIRWPARRQCAGRQCARRPARWKCSISARPSRRRRRRADVVCGRARRRSRFFPTSRRSAAGAVETMRSIRLHRGEIVRIGSLIGGAVLYVAVEGGFDIEPVLGSVSTDIRGGIGGWQGRALAAGDLLPLRLHAQPRPRRVPHRRARSQRRPALVRAIAGPQSDYFSALRDRGILRQRIHGGRRLQPHGHAARRPADRTRARPQHHLRRHRAGLDPGARQRPADRAPGRPPDHRRISEDRDRHLGRSAGARPAADRREDPVRARHASKQAQWLRRAPARRDRADSTNGSCRSDGSDAVDLHRKLSGSQSDQRRGRRPRTGSLETHDPEELQTLRASVHRIRGARGDHDRRPVGQTRADDEERVRARGGRAAHHRRWSPRQSRTTTSRAASCSWSRPTVLFSISSAFAKWQVAIYPVGEVMFFRSFSSLVVCAAFILPFTGLVGVRHAPAARPHRARPVAVDLADLHRHRVQHDAARRRHRDQFLRAAVVGAALGPVAQGARRSGRAGWCCWRDSSASSSSPIRAPIRFRSARCSRSAMPSCMAASPSRCAA